MRFAAAAIENHLVLFPVAGAVAFGAYQPSLGRQAVGFVAWVAYFALLEGTWGAYGRQMVVRSARRQGDRPGGRQSRPRARPRPDLRVRLARAGGLALPHRQFRYVWRSRCGRATDWPVDAGTSCWQSCSIPCTAIDSRAFAIGSPRRR